VKNVAKSSAVRVDEGGGGGKRREGFEKHARVIFAVEALAVKEERRD